MRCSRRSRSMTTTTPGSRASPERGHAALAGVPWGADMRLYCARGIPACMVGTGGIELAHAVDERVRVDEVAAVARIIASVVCAGG